MKIECSNPRSVAKRAFFLAYESSSAMGLGFIQARSNVTEDDVWTAINSRNDNNPYADYTFGRMMKLSINFNDTFVSVPDSQPRGDYQSWCRKYQSYESLIEAAVKSLAVESQTVAA